MNEKLSLDLGPVQKTLLLPLWGRALESKEEDPLIRDPYAQDIVERLDFDFTAMHPYPDILQVNCAVRAFNFDDALHKVISAYPDATIVNIGAGLDTSYRRVDNGKIFWYDLDMPDTIALRKQLLPEGDRNRMIACSAFDRSWFREVKVRGSRMFFMAAGVLAYFPEAEIKSLFLDMMREFPGCEICFEIYAKWVLNMRKRGVRRNANAGFSAEMQWTARSAKYIARWDRDFHVLETYPYYSRVNFRQHWTDKNLMPVKILRLFRGLKMVRLQLGK